MLWLDVVGLGGKERDTCTLWGVQVFVYKRARRHLAVLTGVPLLLAICLKLWTASSVLKINSITITVSPKALYAGTTFEGGSGHWQTPLSSTLGLRMGGKLEIFKICSRCVNLCIAISKPCIMMHMREGGGGERERERERER